MSTDSTAELEPQFVDLLARELDARPDQVNAAAALFAGGATVPFVARYRKEVTGGLLDEKLELLAKRREYYLELTQRRDAILESIAGQGKLTPELEAGIRAAGTKQELEDLYLPYRPRRRTRAQIARERGLEPLADALLDAASAGTPVGELAGRFVDPERDVEDAASALAGARDILAERLAEYVENRTSLRAVIREEGRLRVRVIPGKEEEGRVYRDYFDHVERVPSAASHRLLAIFRGEREGFLVSDMELDDDRELRRLETRWGVPLESEAGGEIALATQDGFKRLLRPSITSEIRSELRERAEAEAIAVFRENLESLLMQSPLGRVCVMGIDPGYRTGCKLAVVDGTGKVLDTGVVHLQSREAAARTAVTVVELVRRHGIRAIAVGNGTGSREAEIFVRNAVKDAGSSGVIVAIVPETGASVYSASSLARKELPGLDVSIRGAVSIARRMQDPLAELVKIEPRSLGVGQYQHDVDQKALGGELDLAVERVVNRVGVELNTASTALLRRVSGLSERLARSVVAHRDDHGAFRTRRELLSVSGFGPKTFELAAGFLRIRDGENPLDGTAVHPERYSVVESMASDCGVALEALVGNAALVSALDFGRFADASRGLGEFTLEDIRAELLKPGRDPRPEFRVPELREDVRTIEDVKADMILEGRVSNVTNFGAFVDLGVKRDGLVHLSELSRKWVDDPRKVVQVGQIVRVKVVEVDRDRGRIGLSMKALEPGAPGSASPQHPRRSRSAGRGASGGGRPPVASSKGQGKRKKKAREAGPESTSLEDLLKKFAPRH